MISTDSALRPLRELTIKIGSGATPKGGKRAYRGCGIPLVRSMNVYDLRFASSGLAFIDEDQAAALDHVTIQRDDVLLNITGASVARCAFAPANMVGGRVNQHVAIIRPDPVKVDGRYLSYVLVSDPYKRQLLGLASAGATREALTKSGLEQFCVPAPCLRVQQRIASILSAYDKLIENNSRRIAVLEEMCHRIFGAEFLSDRAGHPDLVHLGALIDFDPKTSVEKAGLKPFLPMTAVEPNSMVVSDWEHRQGRNGSKFRNGDTLLARITPCLENGKTAYVDFLPPETTAFGSTEFIVMRGRGVPPEFVYCLARSEPFRKHAIKGMTGTSGRQRVSAQAVAQFEIPSPDPIRAIQFGEIVRPMFGMIRSLADANNNLRTTRDFLLPKLISGEIEVRPLEEALEAGGE